MFAFQHDETYAPVEATLRQYCEGEIEPRVEALESGEVSPYSVMRELSATLGLDQMLGGGEASGDATGSGETSEGGTGGGAPDPALLAIFGKELARVSPGLCLCVAANFGCGSTIAARGDAELVARCARPVLTLERVGCWALTEPETGSDAFALRTTAYPDGDELVLRGHKTFISNAPEADVLLVYAKLAEEGRRASRGEKQRVFPIVVERGTPGLETGPAMAKFGMHASPTGEVVLDGARVPRAHLLGDPDAPARDAAEGTLATERASIVAMCLGVIERCLEDAVSYAAEREQFDKPIGAHQLVQQKLARIYVAYHNTLNLMHELIALQRSGGARTRQVSAAKLYASEAAAEAALEAMQLLGGAGYVRGHAPERLFRDIKLWTIGGGTSEIQQLHIAKDLLREQGLHVDMGGGYRRED